jgi:hypothetical protein
MYIGTWGDEIICCPDDEQDDCHRPRIRYRVGQDPRLIDVSTAINAILDSVRDAPDPDHYLSFLVVPGGLMLEWVHFEKIMRLDAVNAKFRSWDDEEELTQELGLIEER